MKILYVSTISNTVNAFLIPHIKILYEEGYRIDVAFNIINPINDNLKKYVYNIHEIPFQRSPLDFKNLKAYKKIKKIIKEENYDIIHVHTPVASLITRLANRNGKAKVIYTAHGFHFYKNAPMKNWLLYYPMEKWMTKYSDAIIVINREDYKLAKDKMNPKRLYYLPGVGINSLKFRPKNKNIEGQSRTEMKLNHDDKVIIMVGELNSNKNQHVIIDAISLLVKKDRKYKLLLVGDGPLEKGYKEKIKILDLEKNIFMLGRRSDIPFLLQSSDILISSSNREGLPVNVIEAMSVGLPIIASKIRGNVDLIEDGRNGYLVDGGTAENYANVIKQLFDNKEKMLQMSKNNIADSKLYSIEVIGNEVKNIYKDVINDV